MSCTVRVLGEADRAAVCGFLDERLESSMFLRANLERAGFVDRGEYLQGTYAGVFDGGELVGVGAHFWSSFITLQCETHTRELVRCLVRESGRSVAGLIGPWRQLVEACAEIGRSPADRVAGGRDVLYRLGLDDLVVPQLLAASRLVCRQADAGDAPLLAEHCFDYAVELLGATDSEETRRAARAQAEGGIAEGSLFVLVEAGRIVSKSHFNAQFADLVQIGGVWTPPALRCRGFGRTVVAGSLLLARQHGARRAVLFTGEGNFAARRAYEALGFVERGGYGLLIFRGRFKPREM